jgi:hypothetical protein
MIAKGARGMLGVIAETVPNRVGQHIQLKAVEFASGGQINVVAQSVPIHANKLVLDNQIGFVSNV